MATSAKDLNFVENISISPSTEGFSERDEIVRRSILGQYNAVELAFVLMTLALIILVTIIGNILVVVSILVERTLRNVSNYLTASLAIADLMVAVLVLPLAAVYQVSSSWWLGEQLCDVFISFDVLCCTSSILHLVAISLDRYWAVTQVDYIHNRSARRILFMIATSWGLSVAISIPPLIIDKDRHITLEGEPFQCTISQNLGYTVFSTVGAFYLPLALMIIIYQRIFHAARKSIRKKRFRNIHRFAESSVAAPSLDGSQQRGSDAGQYGQQTNNESSGIEIPSNVSHSPTEYVVSSGTSALQSTTYTLPTIQFSPICRRPSDTGKQTEDPTVFNIYATSDEADPDSSLSRSQLNTDKSYGKSREVEQRSYMKKSQAMEFNFHNAELTSDEFLSEGEGCLIDDKAGFTHLLQINDFYESKKTNYEKLPTHQTNLIATRKANSDDRMTSDEIFINYNACLLIDGGKETDERQQTASQCANLSDGQANEARINSPDISDDSCVKISVNGLESSSEDSHEITTDRGKYSALDYIPKGPSARRCDSVRQRRTRATGEQRDLDCVGASKRRQSDVSSDKAYRKTQPDCDMSLLTPIAKQSKLLSRENGNGPLNRRAGCFLDVKSLSPPSPLGDDSMRLGGSLAKGMGSRRGSWLDLTKQYIVTAVTEHRRGTKDVQMSPRTRERRAREKMEQRRERKAARTLAIVTGAFIVCWLPFFILALIMPFCGELCHVPELLQSIINWLGYFNSLLNPIIYTVFNPDFRSAFRRLLFGRIDARRGRRGAVDYRRPTEIRLTSHS